MAAKYMPGTKFEMLHFDGPMDMHRVAIATLGIGINWTTNGDAKKDPEHYTEEFEIIDGYTGVHREHLTRSACENYIFNAYCEEVYG